MRDVPNVQSISVADRKEAHPILSFDERETRDQESQLKHLPGFEHDWEAERSCISDGQSLA